MVYDIEYNGFGGTLNGLFREVKHQLLYGLETEEEVRREFLRIKGGLKEADILGVSSLSRVVLPRIEGSAPTDDENHMTEGDGIRNRLSSLLPVDVDARFIEHLHKEYKIRLLYRESIESDVRKWFQDNNLSLPNDIRPVKSDMQGISGSVTFLTPEDLTMIPAVKYILRGKKTEINNLSLVVCLLKLGFSINSYTKI